MLCGSHLIQSHSPMRSALAQTLIRTSSGECATATWAISARTRSRTARESPSAAMRVNARSRTATGNDGTLEWLRMNRRSAPAQSGSRSSTRLGLRRHQPQRQRLGARGEPDVEEVAVRGGALPHPPGHDQRRQSPGIRAVELHDRALRRRRAPRLQPDLREVAQVVTAQAVQLDLPVAAAAGDLADHHPGHPHGHRPAAHVQDRAGMPARDDRDHADRHRAHRQVHQRLREPVGSAFGQLGRGLQADLTVRHRLRGIGVRRAVDGQRAHFLPQSSVPFPGGVWGGRPPEISACWIERMPERMRLTRKTGKFPMAQGCREITIGGTMSPAAVGDICRITVVGPRQAGRYSAAVACAVR